MSDEVHGIADDRLHTFDRERVVVEDFEAEGLILDLGGGGEGVIGLLKGDRVVAIDASKAELEEAADGPLKIVMDARELKFLDQTFEVVTSFFTLMYIGAEDHLAVFEEACRVLTPEGRLLIWDVELPERMREEEDIVVLPLLVELPTGDIETGYGTYWPEEPLDASHYVELAERVGLSVVQCRHNGRTFFLELRRPAF